MKSEIKLFGVALLWGASMLLFTGCKDEALNFDNPEYASVLYMGDVGEVSVDFYNVNQDIIYSTFVGKGGTDNDIDREAKLRVWTISELEEYNTMTGTDYQLLPENCYILQKDFLFSAGDKRKLVEITLKKQIGELERGVQYVLPIELESPDYSVNKTRARVFVKPVIITPVITQEKIGKQDGISLSVRDNNVTSAVYKTSLRVNMQNQGWAFGVDLETDENILSRLVDEFNRANNTGNYKLLPKKNYAIPEILFNGTENNKELSIDINRMGLTVGDYILPISLAGCTGMPFDVSSEIAYVHVEVTDELPKIALSLTNISANSTDGNSLPNLINGLYDDQGWQSQWYNANIGTPISDPKYGVFIDLKNLSIADAARLILTIKTTHNNPRHLQIYGGTAETNLRLLHETVNAFPNTATQKKYDTGVFGAKGITMIRIALITNVKDTDMRTLQFYSGSYIQNVSLSEIDLLGI